MDRATAALQEQAQWLPGHRLPEHCSRAAPTLRNASTARRNSALSGEPASYFHPQEDEQPFPNGVLQNTGPGYPWGATRERVPTLTHSGASRDLTTGHLRSPTTPEGILRGAASTIVQTPSPSYLSPLPTQGSAAGGPVVSHPPLVPQTTVRYSQPGCPQPSMTATTRPTGLGQVLGRGVLCSAQGQARVCSPRGPLTKLCTQAALSSRLLAAAWARPGCGSSPHLLLRGTPTFSSKTSTATSPEKGSLPPAHNHPLRAPLHPLLARPDRKVNLAPCPHIPRCLLRAQKVGVAGGQPACCKPKLLVRAWLDLCRTWM